VSEWHEINEVQSYFEKQSINKQGFKLWYCKKMIAMCKKFKQWIADDHNSREDD